MMRPLQMEEALAILGLTHLLLEEKYKETELAHPEVSQGSAGYFNMLTEVYHQVIKEARKRKTFELHPDRCKDLDATERCARVNQAADELLKIRILPKPAPRPAPQIFGFNLDSFFSMHDTTSTSNTTICFTNDFQRVIKITFT